MRRRLRASPGFSGAPRTPSRGPGRARSRVRHRPQAEAVLDRGHDRRRVVRGVVDRERAAQAGRDRQRRDPGRGSHLVVRAGRRRALARRRDVVPLAAELVVGDDDHRVLRAGDRWTDCRRSTRWSEPGVLAGVAGVLVLGADRLDQAHRLEPAVPARARRRAPRTPPRRAGAARRAVGARGERRVVVERLVVVLEQLVRAVREDRAGRRLGVGAGAGRGAVRPARARRRRRWRSTSRPSTRPSRRPSRSGGRRSWRPSAAAAAAPRRSPARRAGRAAGSC